MPALEELVVSGGVMGREELQLLLAALEAAPGLQVGALAAGSGQGRLFNSHTFVATIMLPSACLLKFRR